MAQNYTRQSTLSDGDTITASLFNDEYNQLVNAFTYSSTSASSTGHRHDGSAGQGGNIFKIGDLDFLNKIEVDSTNNRWGFYVEVSSAAVEQIRIQDGAIVPVTDNDIDLGTSSLEFKDLYIDGTAHIDTLDVDANATVAGTLAVTGTTTLTGNVTTTNDLSVGGNLTVTGTTTFNGGTITMGDAATDNVVFGADVDSHIIPDDDDTYDLGSTTQQWRNLYIDGTAEIDTLSLNGAAVTSTAAEINLLDGVTATTAELNILDGVTATTAELNLLDGVTSTTAELNILDGVTSTATELNLLDGITGILDEDNMASNSATALATQQSIKAYVDSQVDTVDTLSEVLANGNTTGGTDIQFSAGDNITNASGDFTIDIAGDITLDAGGADIIFADDGTEVGRLKNVANGFQIQSSASNKDLLFVGSDAGVDITALSLDMSSAGAATFNGNLTVNGADVTVTANIKHAGDSDTYYGFHGNDLWRVVTGGTERLEASNNGIIVNDSGADADFRVESNGNANMLFIDAGNDAVALGTTDIDNQNNSAGSSADNGLAYNLGSGGYLSVARYGGVVAYLNRTDSDGTILDIRKDGSTVGTLGSNTARFFIHNNYGTGSGLRFDNAFITPASATGATEDNTTDLGASSARFKDLYLSGTANAGGLTVDGGANLLTRTSSGAEVDVLEVRNNATATSTASTIKFVNSTSAGSNSGSTELVAVRTGTNTGDFKVRTSNSTGSMIDRLLVNSGGDISFYEDTGTTQKLIWSAASERLTLKTSGSFALDVQASANTSATIAQFSNNNGSDKAYIALDSTGAGKLVLLDGGNNEDVLIQASGTSYYNTGGNFLIGKSSADLSEDGIEFRDAGLLAATRTSNAPLYLRRSTDNGDLAVFYKDSLQVGSLGTIDSDFLIHSTVSGHAGLRFGNGYVGPTNNAGTITDNAVSLGISTHRYTDLYLSGGFPGTASGSLVVNDNSVDSDFRVESNNNANMLVVDAGNDRVGVGGTPTAPLDVRGANSATFGRGQLYISNTESAAINQGSQISFGGTYSGTSDTFLASIAGRKENDTAGNYDGYLSLATRANGGNNTEHMRITSQGLVGINETSPDYRLHVKSGTENVVAKFESTDSTSVIQFVDNSGNSEFGTSGSTARISPNGSYAVLEASQSAVVLNNASQDTDFRVESDGNAHMFFVDAGNNRIGINTSAPDKLFHVFGGNSGSAYTPDGADLFILENSDSAIIDIRTPAANSGGILFSDAGARGRGQILYSHSTDALNFTAGSVGRLSLSGSDTIFNDSSTDTDFRVESNNKTHLLFVDAGNDRIGINDSSPSHLLTVKSDHATNPAIKIEQTGNTDGWGFIANNNEGRLEFSRIGGGTEGTHLAISNVGKVLIGDVASHTDDLLQIETPASGGGHGIQIRRNDSNTDQNVGRVLFGNNTDTELAQVAAKTDGATDSGALLFSTSATGASLVERMRIASDYTVQFKMNTGGLSHVFGYNENGGEISLYDDGGAQATLIDQSNNSSRFLELINGSNLAVGLGSANTTGDVLFYRAGFNEAMRLKSSEIAVNDASADLDFRVESNNNAHALFVDAGNSSVNINTGTSSAFALKVIGTAASGARTGFFGGPDVNGSTATSAPVLTLENTNATTGNMTLLGFQTSSSISTGVIGFKNIDLANGYGTFYLGSRGSVNGWSNKLAVYDTEYVINEDSLDYDFRVESNGNSHMLFVDAGNDAVGIGGSPVSTSQLTVKAGSDTNLLLDGESYSTWVQDAEWNTLLLGGAYWDSGAKFAVTNRGASQIYIGHDGDATPAVQGFIFSSAPHGNAGNSPSFENLASITRAGTVFNEDSKDRDFRIESDNNSSAFQVDASTGQVCIGRGANSAASADVVTPFGTYGLLLESTDATVANNEYVDITINTGGGGYQGMMVVANTVKANAGARTQSLLFVAGRGTDGVANVVSTDTGSGAASFTVTFPSNGVARVTNTSGSTTAMTVQFLGGQSF